MSLPFHSYILKVPFENSGGSGIVYIWIGEKATQEEAIHAEQMGRSMFGVGVATLCNSDVMNDVITSLQSTFSNVVTKEGSEPENFFWVALGGRQPYDTVREKLASFPGQRRLKRRVLNFRTAWE